MNFRKAPIALALALSLAALSACATDAPTEVGDVLLPSGDVVTFEVILPAAEFLQYDTSFSGYLKTYAAGYQIIAHKREGVVEAVQLARFTLPPKSISVVNNGTTVTDSLPRYFSGTLVLKLDTTLIAGTRPARLRLLHTAEAWHTSATWASRLDTAGVRQPWATPGGTRGAPIDTATWAGGDSITFHVDSASLAVWADTTRAARGAMIVAETDGAFLKVISTVVHVSAHSSVRADTVVNVDLAPTDNTFILDPMPAPQFSGVRVGGVPSWRSILRLRDDLQGRLFPCANGPPGCTVSLDSVHISAAHLLLKPTRPPLGFLPEDSMYLEVRTLSPSPLLPLERTAIGSHVGFSDQIAPVGFSDPADTTTVLINVTPFLRHLTDAKVAAADRQVAILTLLQLPEAATFGVAAFDGSPRLRIVLTSNVERRP